MPWDFETAVQTLEDLRVAEVVQQDVTVETGRLAHGNEVLIV
jgi:flavin-binding protein dodecin